MYMHVPHVLAVAIPIQSQDRAAIHISNICSCLLKSHFKGCFVRKSNNSTTAVAVIHIPNNSSDVSKQRHVH